MAVAANRREMPQTLAELLFHRTGRSRTAARVSRSPSAVAHDCHGSRAGLDRDVACFESLSTISPFRALMTMVITFPRIWYNRPFMAAARRPNDFEKAFQQLEKIVQRLEGEELPLDESLQLFEEGIKLSRFCHQRLEEVEKKIELILADAKGQPVTEPFEDEEIHEDEEITE
jgi:exodeoxyribonuclease VII small subunit